MKDFFLSLCFVLTRKKNNYRTTLTIRNYPIIFSILNNNNNNDKNVARSNNFSFNFILL
jgi:uncharacterized protein Veg